MQGIMIISLPPAAIFIVGALFIPLLRGRVKSAYMLFLPVLAFGNLFFTPEGTHWVFDFQHMAACFYAGSALGITFVGDFFSLFVFWEILAVASTVLIWSRRTEASLQAGFRYILVHIFGGLCLLAGIIL